MESLKFFFADPKIDSIPDLKPLSDSNREFSDPLHP